MIPLIRLAILSCSIISAVIISPGTTFSHKNSITFAALPCSDAVRTFERFKPLADYIEKKTGRTVHTVFPKNEKELRVLLMNQKADFIFHSPYGYVRIADLINKNSLLKSIGPHGKDSQTGVLVVRKDSGLEKIPDLKGKSVLFGVECSASRWVAGRELLEKHGLDIEKDLAQYGDGGCCEDICFNIILKAVDAGLVCKHYYDTHKYLQSEQVRDLTVIATTDPMPTRFFAAHKDTPPDILAAVKTALLAIDKNNPDHHRIIELTDIGGFMEESANFYEDLNSKLD